MKRLAVTVAVLAVGIAIFGGIGWAFMYHYNTVWVVIGAIAAVIAFGGVLVGAWTLAGDIMEGRR